MPASLTRYYLEPIGRAAAAAFGFLTSSRYSKAPLQTRSAQVRSDGTLPSLEITGGSTGR